MESIPRIPKMSDYTPLEIQLQILHRLPVKTLLRFRCVCKQWKKLIDSPTFVQDHLSVQNPFLLFQSDCEGLSQELFAIDPRTLPLVDTLTPPFVEEYDNKVTLFGTHHGVVCMYYYDDDVVLWNPSLRKYTSLPVSGFFISCFNECWASCYGFWIDPCTQEFIIVSLCFYNYEGREDELVEPLVVEMMIYSSIEGCWASGLPPKIPKIWGPAQGPPIMIGGVGYWLGGHSFLDHEQGIELNSKAILSLDFKIKSFEFIDIPGMTDIDPTNMRLFQGKEGTLEFACWDSSFPCSCDIYSIVEGSCSKRYSCDLSAVAAYVVWEMGERDMGVVNEGDDTERAELVLHETRVGLIPLAPRCARIGVTYNFVESLLFPVDGRA